MPFTDPRVSVTQVEDNLWQLDRELHYEDRYGFVARIPKLYRTDFATVPRLIWWLVPTYGNYTAATVLHDYLLTETRPSCQFNPREIDRIFREAMAALGVSFVRRWLMWAGVRWGALFNRKRRKGVWKDMPLVLLISALALPFVLPAIALVPALLVFSLLDRLT